MEIIFPGTGSGKTTLTRYTSSLYLRTNNHGLLIDTGDSVTRALIAAGIPLESIDSIIITHLHADHFAGLPSLLTNMKLEGRENPLTLFCHRELENNIKAFLDMSYIFPEKMPFEIKITGTTDDVKFRAGKEFEIVPVRNTHIRNKHNVEPRRAAFVSTSLLIEAEGKKIIYTSDVGSDDDYFLFDEREPDIYITEFTHASFEALEKVYAKYRPGKFIITHLGEEEENIIKEDLKEGKETYYTAAEDGMKMFLP